MKRRTLLSLVSGGALTLAGCTESLPGGADTVESDPTTATVTATTHSTERETATPTATQTERETATETQAASCETTQRQTTAAPTTGAPGEGWPRVSVNPMDSPYEEAALDAFATRQFSDDAPARIRVTYTNVTCLTRKVSFGTFPPFSRIFSEGATEEGENALYIVPHNDRRYISYRENVTVEDGIPVNKQDGCWAAIPGTYGFGTYETIGAGETISETYSVFNKPYNDGCLPAGDYDFTLGNYTERGEPWGFTVSLAY